MPTNEELFLAGDIDRLYSENTGLMHHLCRKFGNTGIEYDELFGQCEIAFMKAYKTFKASQAKWATYFSFVANNEILMYLRKQKKYGSMLSLNAAMSTDIEGKELTLEDILSTSETLEDALIEKDQLERLQEAIELLNERDRELIKARLKNINQRQIAEQMGLSQSFVSRQEKAIQVKLRKFMEGRIPLSKKNKSKKQVPFNPPTRFPNNAVGQVLQVQQKKINDRILEESNNTLNLISSAYSIVLKEFFNFSDEQLKEALTKSYEQLELCAQEIVTIDQMMMLCAEYGLEVQRSEEKLDAFGTMMMKKVTAFELLDKGIEEVEDISKQGKMTSREASAFRWMYNKLKFGKDYEGDVVMASTRKLAFEMFDKGVDYKKAAIKLESPINTVKTYHNSWKREVLETLSTEEAAPYFAGEKELWQIKKEKIQGAKNEVVAEIPKAQEPLQETAAIATEVIKNEPVAIESNNQEVSTLVGSTAGPRKGLKKKVQLEGEFAIYKPCNINLMDVELYGQVVSMTKEEALTLAEELIAAVDEELLWKGAI
ncbi:sigma-70 family RNA polymerase sigma factor [Cellulosilyticum sp. WCF-2]|uniref:sigma-70 family RNA polymerase sigma factor n=1 Tax=Cellulosilyticum sp. WCF-2 TaxID=2497860 RepID=UPI000F8D5DE4|nr:sigma-70 family RNA polymerase sigma factor [Cellulosilyticum sp. WCF-2]QEH69745.1 sigma-70 family RNA polymerase sigma factor [Cellulosilyticum sp. WCF-2]